MSLMCGMLMVRNFVIGGKSGIFRRAWLGLMMRSARRAYRREYSRLKTFLARSWVEWGER